MQFSYRVGAKSALELVGIGNVLRTILHPPFRLPRGGFGRPISIIHAFISNASSGGIILMGAAALALVVVNFPLGNAYEHVLHAYIGGLSVLHWINDGLMAVFFLMVGLEIKREVLDGQLSTWSRRILPGTAALGGMVGPALVYLAFNMGSNGHPAGWAVPAATDIAFALGILPLLRSRVPMSLKVFLTALAIIDDLGAVIIIALFYTSSIDALALGGAALTLGALIALNRFRVMIGLLAFPDSMHLQNEVKLGVVVGSTLSAIAGALLLLDAKPRSVR